MKRKYVNHPNHYCKSCGANLTKQKGFSTALIAWLCTECKQPLFNPEADTSRMRFPDMIQFCDRCDAILNNQPGFSDWNNSWKCTECGFVTQISEENNYDTKGEYDLAKNAERAEKMTIDEAIIIVDEMQRKPGLSEDEEFSYIEALEFLINETKDSDYMVSLGAYYYEQKRFDLALKYYELAAEYANEYAFSNLGYIWYYGRTGEYDYKKAFECYSKAADKGNIICRYKIADMYKNGYYVEKDYEKYKAIIEDLYLLVKDTDLLSDPLPEIFTRLSRIRLEEGRESDAEILLLTAKDFLAQRISYNPFFGDLSIMKDLILNLYSFIDFDDEFFDLYDLYLVLSKPAVVSFVYDDKTYQVESTSDTGECSVHFNGKWYRTIDDFFAKASIGSQKLTTIYDDLYDFEIERRNTNG